LGSSFLKGVSGDVRSIAGGGGAVVGGGVVGGAVVVGGGAVVSGTGVSTGFSPPVHPATTIINNTINMNLNNIDRIFSPYCKLVLLLHINSFSRLLALALDDCQRINKKSKRRLTPQE